jgi:CubicO group peptidase (beta-lactamase class C family)
MTKPLSAAAVMLQYERGKLTLNDNVDKYLPGFGENWVGKMDANGAVVPDHKAATPLTIRHLLTHTCGLLSGPVGMAQMAAMPPDSLLTEASFVDYMNRSLLLDFDPGSQMAYSGIGGFDVLACLVELTSDLPIEDYLARNLFTPLEMPDTTFTPTQSQLERLVAMHDTVDGRSVALPRSERLILNLPNTLHSGSASLLGTAEDYLHFAEMLANGGLFKGRRVMQAETVALAGSPWLDQGLPGLFPGMNWGAGMMVRLQSVLPTGSFGWSGAFGTHFWADPANRLAAVYMRNSDQANGAGAATAFRFEEDVMACVVGN